MRRQHFKGRKRLKSWHRGQAEGRRWARTALPDLNTGADPTTGTPQPIHLERRTGKQQRGDSI